jgi:hypothetical protein
VERTIYQRLKNLAEKHRNGTAYWYQTRNDCRISAFYGSYSAYEAIAGWEDSETAQASPAWQRLGHGYDESEPNLNMNDLQRAATFRGGRLLSTSWNGDLYTPLVWQCAYNHHFEARPYTVIKAGHWCPECLLPPWNYDQQARLNPFFAQVWYADHAPDENNEYPKDCTEDILDADLYWRESSRKRAG